MVSGLMAFKSAKELNESTKMLFLGGGGCCVPKFLFDHFEGLDVTVIELDQNIVKVAEKYF